MSRPGLRSAGLAVLAAAAAALVLTVGPGSSGPPDARADEVDVAPGDKSAPRTVVVELFTSQGCSSCPPADRLLSELRDSGEAAGVEIISLSFHVDYWNYIGWTDPFSSAAWSERQRRYGAALDLDTVYTPQTVIDGYLECVGSSRRQVTRLLADAATLDDVAVSLDLSEGAARVRVRGAPDRGELDVYLAIWEDGLVTPVVRGENARKTLENDSVVRRFQRLGTVTGSASAEWTEPLAVDPGWSPERLGAAVVVQDPRTMRIHGSAARRLPKPRVGSSPAT